jgi:hypothetical protein
LALALVHSVTYFTQDHNKQFRMVYHFEYPSINFQY